MSKDQGKHVMDWFIEQCVEHFKNPKEVELSKAMGRPPWAPSEKDLIQIENAAARGLSKSQIATYIGIGYSTMATKYEEYPEIRERIKKGRDLAIAEVANGLFEMATGPNIAGKLGASIFYLKNVAGWADRRIEEGNPNKPLWVGATHKDPTEEQKAERLRILHEATADGTDPAKPSDPKAD